MSLYTHKKITPLRVVALCLRGLVKLLNAWPLLLVIAFIASPVGPHLRWTYEYRDISRNYRVYISCQYVGSRGMVNYMRGDTCPLLTIIDRDKS